MSQEVLHVITPATVKLMVTNSRTNAFSETRLQKGITILELKHRLELVTGILQATMKLELYNKVGNLVAKISDDNALLGSFPVDDDMRLHVIGQSSLPNEFEDLSLVEKKVLSEEEYSKKDNTLRAYLVRNKLGKYSERPADEPEGKTSSDNTPGVDNILVGSRCEVCVPGQPTKRGEVKYVGETDFKPGVWVGIQYDEPLGKNDGSVDGKEYFKCPMKYGAFVRPQHVKTGDFPEEDYLNDEM